MATSVWQLPAKLIGACGSCAGLGAFLGPKLFKPAQSPSLSCYQWVSGQLVDTCTQPTTWGDPYFHAFIGGAVGLVIAGVIALQKSGK